MSYIQRHLQPHITSISESWPVVLITGARQTGKTTMLRYLAKQETVGRTYVTLDDPVALDMAKHDPKLFFQIYKPPVLVDEVQYAPELFREVKRLSDERQTAGDFWLTGSQIFSMMDNVQESLAGRAAIIRMSSLSQREILGRPPGPFSPGLCSVRSGELTAADASEVFARLWRGAMPGLISGARREHSLYYSSYVSTYLQRDIRQLAGVSESLKFQRFLTEAAARTAQLVNFESLAADSEITSAQARTWLRILETLGIVFLLHPFSNNMLKRTTKTPKLYFDDTGLVCYLTQWLSPQTAVSGAMSGALLENYAISEIRKGYLNSAEERPMYFYRDRDGKEIDLVLEMNDTLFPAEVKKAAAPDRRIFRTFETLRRSDKKLGTGCVLCLADHPGGYSSDQLIVPIASL